MPLKINRNKLFTALAIFALIVNLLVWFDINALYIRAVLAFLFIILVPGLLIMLMLKIREVGFWEYLVYTIGLSISFIMFAGLAVNWTLPLLNITDKPLALVPILISFDIFLVAFSIIAYYRNKDLKYEIKPLKLDTTNRIFFIIPMLFPAMSILGAFILNNNGPNYLTMIMLGGIAVYVFMLVLFRNKLNENIYPWAILMISLSLLLSSSLRSWYISVVDTNLEKYISDLTTKNQFWETKDFNSSYNAMLSVSLLPTILDILTEIKINYIIKLLSPIIFSLVPVIVLLIHKKKFENCILFLSALFFIFQPMFIKWLSIPIRQEIALFFFSLLILIAIEKRVPGIYRKLILILFGFSMIVSHYSTSYIGLVILVFLFLLKSIYQRKDIHQDKLEKSKLKSEFFIIAVLLIFSFFWYSKITTTSSGLIGFAKGSINNLKNIFSEEVQASGQSPLDQFNPFYKKRNMGEELNKYVTETINTTTNYNRYDSNDLKDSIVRTKTPEGVPFRFNENITIILISLKRIIEVLGKILVSFGFLVFLFSKEWRKDKGYYFLIIISFIIFGLIVLMPLITIEYDLLRTYQQFLILICPLVAISITAIMWKFKQNYILIGTCLFFIVYFLTFSGYLDQATGGFEIPLELNNAGLRYSEFYVTKNELLSADWLFAQQDSSKIIFSDRYGNTRLKISDRVNLDKVLLIKDLIPQAFGVKDYVYLTETNIKKGTAFRT